MLAILAARERRCVESLPMVSDRIGGRATYTSIFRPSVDIRQGDRLLQSRPSDLDVSPPLNQVPSLGTLRTGRVRPEAGIDRVRRIFPNAVIHTQP